jgi:hypothetical protein
MGGAKTTSRLTPAGAKLMGTLQALKSKPAVKVGVLSRDFNQPKATEGVGRNAKPTQFGKSASLGEVAIYNEFGTEHTPERSFIRACVDENQAKWRKFADELRKKIIFEGWSTDRALGVMGLRIQRDIQAKMRSDIGPPNAPSTLAAKAPKTKTLINTGQLVNSIAWELMRAHAA